MATVRILTSNSTQPLLDALASEFGRRTGHGVTITCDSAKTMLARIKDGEHGDVVVLGAGAVDELAQLGTVIPGSVGAFARSRVGVGVRTGTPHPDISSVDAFRRALLEAKSVAHTVHGASGMYVPVLLERLGIAERIKPKIVTRPGGFIGRVVVTGEADLAVQQVSELLAVPGIDVVGLLPDEIQKVFITCAGVFSDAKEPAAAQALLDFFAEPACAPTFEAKGLEQAAKLDASPGGRA